MPNRLKHWLNLAILATSLLLTSNTVLAFGQTGHRQICQLAYQLVKAETRAQIDALMQQAPVPQFAEGCIWPDEARNQPEFAFTKPHHFINLPRLQAAVSFADCAKVGCLLSALQHHGAILKNQTNSSAKAQSLLFYSHFIADLHQPLHVSYEDDWGGNKTVVYLAEQATNLHSVWDSGMLKRLGYDQDAKLLSKKLALRSAKLQSAWRKGNATDWAQQSLRYTRMVYAEYQPEMQLTEHWLARYSPTVELRMQQAAVRLAWMLDQLLSPKS